MNRLESVYFKPCDIQEVKFKIQDFQYVLDRQKSVWLAQNVQIMVENDQQIKNNSTRQSQYKSKTQHDQNIIQIKALQDQNQEIEGTIQDFESKLIEIRKEQQILTEEYVLQHLETEKVKSSREKLNKLKKELGI